MLSPWKSANQVCCRPNRPPSRRGLPSAARERLRKWRPAATGPASNPWISPLSPATAAPALVDLFLRLLPQDEATPQAVFSATVERLLQAIGRGSSAAIERVIVWRDTPPAIAATLQEVRSLALAIISGEQPALLSRPEWLGLVTSLQRVRRRRRRALLLSDTDADHLDIPPLEEPPETPPTRGGRR